LRIGLIGWYGHNNIGDDALMCVIYEFLSQHISQGEVFVIADNPQKTREKFGYESIKSFPISIKRLIKERKQLRDIITEWKKLDFVVLGGGGFFADDVSVRNVIKWSAYILVARLLGIRVNAYCLGVGPIKYEFSRFLTRLSFGMIGCISVRDEESCRWLVSAGVKKRIVLSADPVLNFKSFSSDGRNILTTSGIPTYKPNVIIAIPPFFHNPDRWPGQENKWMEYCQSWADTVDEIVSLGSIPIFLPMQHCPSEYYIFSDADLAKKIIKLAKNGASAYTIERLLTPAEVFTVLSGADIVLGMRLHAIILAVSSGTPVAGAIYHHKVGELVRNLGISKYFIDVCDITPQNMISLVRMAWREKNEIRETLRDKLPKLRERIQIGQEALIKELMR
jgi:polysaccharide pyruvyl transferase CsaB